MGRAHFDEEVTQLEHALQTAALAEADGASDELVIAALLHDVGHLLLGEREGELQHEKVGARFLVRRFGREVAGPVALHVPAKRYLLALEPGYAERLSDASIQSLAVQGGAFSPKEAARFIELPYAPDAVALRRWDDRGKVPERTTPDLAHWRPRITGLLGTMSRTEAQVPAGGGS
jgi:predicted HD phosphohydrolase